MNKRDFVLSSCAGLWAASGAVQACPGQATPAAGLRRPPELGTGYSLAKWQRYQGHAFELRTAGGVQHLQLAAVLASERPSPGIEQFSLTFNADQGRALKSGTHVLKHPTGQRVAIFLQPAGTSPQGGRQYQAHFSLLA